MNAPAHISLSELRTLRRIQVACNDDRNGHFAARANAIEIHLSRWESIYLEAADRVPVFRELDGRVRLSRRMFDLRLHRCWVGNWCWNEYVGTVKESRRLLRYLREMGIWYAAAGSARICRWFES